MRYLSSNSIKIRFCFRYNISMLRESMRNSSILLKLRSLFDHIYSTFTPCESLVHDYAKSIAILYALWMLQSIFMWPRCIRLALDTKSHIELVDTLEQIPTSRVVVCARIHSKCANQTLARTTTRRAKRTSYGNHFHTWRVYGTYIVSSM